MRISMLTSSLQFALFASSMLGLYGEVVQAAPTPTGQPVAYVLTPNNTITAVDTGSHAVLRTFPLAAAATGIVGTPDGKQLYITTTAPTAQSVYDVVEVIDTQTGEVTTTLPLLLPHCCMTISADGTRVYVATQLGTDDMGSVVVIDTASNTELATVGVNYSPQDIAVSPDGKRVYVPSFGSPEVAGAGSLDVIDTSSNTLVQSLQMADAQNQFSWVAVSPDSSKIYAYDYWINVGSGANAAGVDIYAASTYAILNPAAPIPQGGRLRLPLPNSSILYGTNGGSVLVYNTSTDTLANTIPVATTVSALALTPDGTQLYAVNSNAQSISIIATATNTVTASIAVSGASGIAILPAPTTVVSVPPTVTLEASPTSVLPGAVLTLDWTSTGATSCTSSGAWNGSAALQGDQELTLPAVGNYTFTLTCAGPGGTGAASAKVSVIPGSTLSASASDLPVRSSVTLTWKATAGATSCVASGAWSGTLPISGSKTIGPFNQSGTQKFSLNCGDPVSTQVAFYGPAVLQGTPLTPPNNNIYAVGAVGTAVPSGGLDGHGYAYDGQDVPSPLTALGQTFSTAALTKPNGISNGTVTLTGAHLNSLTFLATGVNGPQLNQVFVVTYTDGTTKTFTQSLSDWGTAGNYPGETVATNIGRLSATGAKQGGGFNIYAYTLTLENAKFAKSLQLPKNRNVVVLALNETLAPQATADPITSAFNVDGLAAAGHAAINGGLDGHGYAYDAALLPSGFTGAGQTFTLGAAGQLDAVSNASIPLISKTRVGLTVLATAINGSLPNQTFVVTYSDGSTTAFQQSVSDWGTPQSYAGETLARSTALRITPAGATQGGAWDVYAYTFLTDATKQVVGLTLPKNRNVVAFSVNSLAQ